MFRLLRYFSLTSLAAFVLVTIVLGVFYRQTAVGELVSLEGDKNMALTQAFANSLWPAHAEFVQSASQYSPDELREHGETLRLQQAMMTQVQGLSVVKVKIYDLSGWTAFSTEASQIGESQGENAGFKSALAGKPVSSLIHRDTFNAFDHVIEDRDLIQSYLPVRAGGIGPVEAVFEVYSDVTPLLRQIDATQRYVVLIVLLVLAVLYGVLFLIVRRADRILIRQYTELELVRQEVTAARDQALRLNRLKSDMIASVAHDFRSPLTVVLGYFEMMLKHLYGPLTDEQSEVIERVLNNTRHLNDLIGDLQYQAQLDAGELKIDEAEFAVKDLVNTVKTTAAALAEAKGLALDVELDPSLPPVLRGDLLRLQQVANNLVGNAIKFTEKGGVAFSLRRVNASSWSMVVSDTGPGIREEAFEQIFEPFKKAGDGRRAVGLGLGLHIVRQVVTLMGGTVRVDSTLDRGSTFTVTLPIKTAQS